MYGRDTLQTIMRSRRSTSCWIISTHPGAISFDGHQWLEQGFVSDNVERALTSHPRGYAWNLSDALDVCARRFHLATRGASAGCKGGRRLCFCLRS